MKKHYACMLFKSWKFYQFAFTALNYYHNENFIYECFIICENLVIIILGIEIKFAYVMDDGS
jgi:hypothetical protein